MSPRPAKHALKGARVRARLARCASESTALGRAGSYVGGTFKSLWRLAKLVRKDYTQARPGQLRTLARPSAACDAFMPVEARARRSHRRAHGKRCSAAHRLPLGPPPGGAAARAAAPALRRVRCVSAGVHIPLLALLRQRRRVRNRRNRRYAHRHACASERVSVFACRCSSCVARRCVRMHAFAWPCTRGAYARIRSVRSARRVAPPIAARDTMPPGMPSAVPVLYCRNVLRV